MCAAKAQANSPPFMPGQRHVMVSDGAKLAVYDAGKKDAARTLVFIPGWTMPAAIFAPQVLKYSATQRVVAIDPRGQGQSDIVKVGYTLDRRTMDIAEIITQLELKNVVIVGWSLAVLETLNLTKEFPALPIVGIVLIDNSVGEATPPAGNPNFFPNLRQNRDATVSAFVKGMFKQPQHPSFLGDLTAQAQRMPVEASIALLSYPKPREFWREALYAFKPPVAYFITPKFDAQATAVKARRTDAFIRQFPNAGHALFVDDPLGFSAALDDFLKQLP